MAEKEYRRLPGRGVRRQGAASLVSARRCRLWLGRDHLLSAESQWYAEEYKRFYFRDIQAIVVRKTNTGRIISGILGAIGLFCAIGALATGDGLRIFWIVVTSIFGFFVCLNTLYGPTSICHLRTAVQTEELPSLKRLRRARKVVARLRPLIAEAQGPLPPEEIARRMAESVVAQPVASPAATAGAGDAPPVIGGPPVIKPMVNSAEFGGLAGLPEVSREGAGNDARGGRAPLDRAPHLPDAFPPPSSTAPPEGQ